MGTKFICGGDKYEVWGINRVIGLPVFLDNLPTEIKVQEDTFYFPNPFHVSLA